MDMGVEQAAKHGLALHVYAEVRSDIRGLTRWARSRSDRLYLAAVKNDARSCIAIATVDHVHDPAVHQFDPRLATRLVLLDEICPRVA